MRVCITIPGEPVAKGRPRATAVGGQARMFTPKKTRDAEDRVAGIASKQWIGPPWTGPVCVRIDAYFPIRASWSKARRIAEVGMPHLQKPDADNLLKLYEDALNGIAWLDDQQVFDTRCVKWWAPLPRVEIIVSAPMIGHNGGPLL